MEVCSSCIGSSQARYGVADGSARTDLRPGRILFANTSLLRRDANPLRPLKTPKIGNVRLVDKFGNVQSILAQCLIKRVPGYLVESLQRNRQSLHYDAVKDSRVKIIGFGEPFPVKKVQGGDYDIHYQAPELVLSYRLGPCADIWSLGCLVCSPTSIILVCQVMACTDLRASMRR